mgnify:CR=1 FL=1
MCRALHVLGIQLIRTGLGSSVSENDTDVRVHLVANRVLDDLRERVPGEPGRACGHDDLDPIRAGDVEHRVGNAPGFVLIDG